MIWNNPRACKRCGHLHISPLFTKKSADGKFYCTWCGDLAPPLTRKSPKVCAYGKHPATNMGNEVLDVDNTIGDVWRYSYVRCDPPRTQRLYTPSTTWCEESFVYKAPFCAPCSQTAYRKVS